MSEEIANVGEVCRPASGYSGGLDQLSQCPLFYR